MRGGQGGKGNKFDGSFSYFSGRNSWHTRTRMSLSLHCITNLRCTSCLSLNQRLSHRSTCFREREQTVYILEFLLIHSSTQPRAPILSFLKLCARLVDPSRNSLSVWMRTIHSSLSPFLKQPGGAHSSKGEKKFLQSFPWLIMNRKSQCLSFSRGKTPREREPKGEEREVYRGAHR